MIELELSVYTLAMYRANGIVGWSLVLSAFLTGAIIGLFFHRDDFWGGYGSFRRRIVRLGHIALAALGMLNVLYSLTPTQTGDTLAAEWAGRCLIAGSIAMPTICFLSGWRKPIRHLFFIPVILLVTAVALILWGVCQ